MKKRSALFILLTILLLSSILAGSYIRYDQDPKQEEIGLTTLAFRVHNMSAMVAFYSEALGVRFRDVDTGGIQSKFGEIGHLTLKFVPIRDGTDFEGFPVHQPGFEVPDVNTVLEAAIRHGGKVQNEPKRQGARILAAVRDPDGNTIEIYGSQ